MPTTGAWWIARRVWGELFFIKITWRKLLIS
nr:MAG TPA: hypothetical protein [Caudoviricetes sp.]